MPSMRLPLLLAAAALAVAGCQPATDDAAFGQKVRAYLLEHPEVLEEAINKLNAKREQTAAAENVKLLAANRKALIEDARDPVIGDPEAPITVVEFFDYRCGYCKAVAPQVLSLVDANKDVRVVMKEMPILSPESELAARLALQAAEAGLYPAVHRALMAERALDEAAVERIAAAHGLTLARDDKEQSEHLADVQRLAQALQVNGTPAFVIGDTMVAGADMDAIRQAIEAQRRKS